MTIKIEQLMTSSGVQFGTSGVRGLVENMTDEVCFIYVTAFLKYLKGTDQLGKYVGIAGDLRFSSPRIMNAVAAACMEMEINPINCGFIPSPAIALFGLQKNIPTIMVTGSHIPDNRNGIKFNTPVGEILKLDEQEIKSQQVVVAKHLFLADGMLKKHDYLPTINNDAKVLYINRFIDFFPGNYLAGMNIGLYEHSSVARDCLKIVLETLGAHVVLLGRSKSFVAVDTEAIRPEDIQLAKQWSNEHHFDCIISTDGDGDRPLVSDEHGQWLRGDIAGILCAQYLGANTVITPVSSNTAVEKSHMFNDVIRTKIGSPYVIEAMQQASDENKENIVGYEANGGFLQHSVLHQCHRVLHPLATRDAIIVPLAILGLSINEQRSISQLVAKLPNRYTHSDREKDFPIEMSQQLLQKISTDNWQSTIKVLNNIFPNIIQPVAVDTTDGVRITLENLDIVHLRPSGNAPEFRCYAESSTVEAAIELCSNTMNFLKQIKLNK